MLAAHPDAAVCTVFAAPPEHDMHTEWDEKAGFANAHQAIHERTIEDNRALEILDAIPLRLPFRASQYADSPSISQIAAALEETIYRTTANTLLMPLGLYHDDHARVFGPEAPRFWPSRFTIDDLHMYPVGVDDVQTEISFFAGDSAAHPQLGDDRLFIKLLYADCEMVHACGAATAD